MFFLTFSTLKRVECYAASSEIRCSCLDCDFQYPQAGRVLCSFVVTSGVCEIQEDFQYPQAGRVLCSHTSRNSPHEDTKPFSTLKRVECYAAYPHVGHRKVVFCSFSTLKRVECYAALLS